MTTTSRLQVRFNGKDYRPAKMVRTSYANKDYFSITLDAGDDVEIKSDFNGTMQKELDPSTWNIFGRYNQNFDNVTVWLVPIVLETCVNASASQPIPFCENA